MEDEDFKPDPGAAEDDEDDPYVPGADADEDEEMPEAEEADEDYADEGDGALAIRKKGKKKKKVQRDKGDDQSSAPEYKFLI
jgi:hypothetical protein